jgi:hypothetical protein
VELVWTVPLSNYGLESRAFLSVAPDESRVVVPPDLSSRGAGSIELSLRDGTRLAGTETNLLGRDAGWTRDLVGTANVYYGVDVLDRGAAAPRLELRGPIGGAGISRDGRYVARLDCQSRELVRHDVETGETVSVSLEAFPVGCPSSPDGQVLPVVVVPGGELALLPWTVPGALAVVDFAAKTALLRPLFAAGEEGVYPRHGTLLALEASPSGRYLAVTAIGSQARVYELQGFEAVLGVETTSVVAFNDCYCVERWFSPVAWSADERYLAALDAAGSTVIRRRTDGAPVAELPPPPEGERGPGERIAPRGAGLLAFTPSGSGLVTATYENGLSGDRVAYYRLSE